MELTGLSFIGYRRGSKTANVLNAFNPATGEILPPAYSSASEEETDEATRLAAESFSFYSATDRRVRSSFLRCIAENLAAFGEALVERAVLETGLSADRIRNERERTCFQLRFFADMIGKG